MAIHILGLDERVKSLDDAAYRRRAELRQLFRWPVAVPNDSNEINSVFTIGKSGTESRAFALTNFVFQGGGILGIAHLGFLFAMEHIGVRTVGVAGTSAGAIVAILLAAAREGDINQPVAKRLLPVLWNMPAASFIDGPYAVRRLVKYALRQKTIASVEMAGPLFGSLSKLLRTFGLNTGHAFVEWLSEVLRKDFDIRTVEDLERHLQQVASDIGVPVSPGDLLKVVATALPQTGSVSIPVGVKLTFPQDLQVLATKYRYNSPALLARASMSVPLFFEPLILDLNTKGWKAFADDRLQGLLAKRVLDELANAHVVAFIDGGMLSNFPIDAFLRNIGPRVGSNLHLIPTVGVTLVSGGRAREGVRKRGLSAALDYSSAVFDGMRHARDRDAIAIARLARASDTAPNIVIAPVDTGDHNWLNFQLDESELSDLFLRGIDGAIRLLNSLHEILHPRRPESL